MATAKEEKGWSPVILERFYKTQLYFMLKDGVLQYLPSNKGKGASKK